MISLVYNTDSKIIPIRTSELPNMYSVNASICNCNNNILCAIRKSQYRIQDGNITSNTGTNRSECVIGRYKGKEDIYTHLIPYSKGQYKFNMVGNQSFTGIEDGRIAYWNDKIYINFARPDQIYNKIIQQIVILDDRCVPIEYHNIETNNTIEKNWQPILDRPLEYIYNPYTGDTIKIDDSWNYIKTGEFDGVLCGSSQVIPIYIDSIKYYISICHYRILKEYQHVFMLYDQNLKPIGTSIPFNFIQQGIEFCCGMCVTDKCIISISLNDNSCFIIEFKLDILYEIINSILNKSELGWFDGIIDPNESIINKTNQIKI